MAPHKESAIGNGETERRIDRLEEQLERVLQELKEIREQLPLEQERARRAMTMKKADYGPLRGLLDKSLPWPSTAPKWDGARRQQKSGASADQSNDATSKGRPAHQDALANVDNIEELNDMLEKVDQLPSDGATTGQETLTAATAANGDHGDSGADSDFRSLQQKRTAVHDDLPNPTTTQQSEDLPTHTTIDQLTASNRSRDPIFSKKEVRSLTKTKYAVDNDMEQLLDEVLNTSLDDVREAREYVVQATQGPISTNRWTPRKDLTNRLERMHDFPTRMRRSAQRFSR